MAHTGSGHLGCTSLKRHGCNSPPIAAGSNGGRSCVTIGARGRHPPHLPGAWGPRSGLDLLLLWWRLLKPGERRCHQSLVQGPGGMVGMDSRHALVCCGAVEPGIFLIWRGKRRF
ncbi:hypothetical protein GWK47_051901 [Chionoecetes opilio]|uniref:Uncharacterized protein n=1 Tax=Chionoecetes opilio TaxID=41210 RepID=A0A8J5CBH9_CHIOP|nr:hypothetical protein GWK47_051901 [Chionoecetes opilio]